MEEIPTTSLDTTTPERVVLPLVASGLWFAVEPWPDGVWRIYVKIEGSSKLYNIFVDNEAQ
jgi:hypothetical protein